MATNKLQATVVGYLGNDAVVRDAGDKKVAECTVYVNHGDTSERVKVCIWGNRGVGVAPKLLKRSLMGFTGTPKANAWLDKDTGKIVTQLVINLNPGHGDIDWLGSAKPQAEEAEQPVDESEIPF